LRFRETRGPVIILTNAPRPASIIPPQLDRLGLPRAAYDAVVTSGDATRAEIAKFGSAPAFRIGPDKDDALFDDLGVNFTTLDGADFIICTGLVDDQSETPDDYRPMLAKAAAAKLVMVCANPDIVVNWGGRMIWCAGALAQIYEQEGGKVIYGGKPHAPIYELAIAAVTRLRGGAAQMPRMLVPRMLAIGDGLGTDIAGANRQGIDAVLVAGAGGIHHGGADAVAIAERLDKAGVHALAAMERLRW